MREPGLDSDAEKAKEPVRKAAETATRRITKENDWWSWVLRAKSEPDPKKVESVYLDALKEFPDEPDLMSHFAIFLMETLNDQDRAEKLFRKAVDLNPTAEMLGNLALFLTRARESEEAEKLYQKALQLKSQSSGQPCQLRRVSGYGFNNKDESLRLFHRAIELAPNDTRIRAEFEKIHGGSDSSA